MNTTKRLIFESAIKVFSESGYNGATMDNVAMRAGVAKGTLYYHFKSKEDIFRFAIEEGMNVINEETKKVINHAGNPIEKIKALCRVELNLLYKNRDFFKVIMSQLWGEQLRQHELRNFIQTYIKFLEDFIKAGFEDGLIKKGNPSLMSFTLFGMICSASVYELLNNDNTDIEEVVENLTNNILFGICA
jgi:TetR/AcrR family transcriptional regulator